MIQEQKNLRAHRRKLAQDLKNAKKKKKNRLQKRARLLSTEDLLTVVALREKDNYNAAELFGAARPNSQESEEEEGSDGEQPLEDANVGEEARSPAEVPGAPSAGN